MKMNTSRDLGVAS